MELIVVSRYRDVIDRCRICKKPRYSNDRQTGWEQHLNRCLAENHDRIMAKRAERNAFHKPWDPELAAYVQDPVRAERILNGEVPMPKG